MKRFVIPGEKLEGRPNAHYYREGNNYYSQVFGILEKKDNFLKIVPLKGKYMPHKGDYVIGIVIDVKYGGVIVDINSSHFAFLPTKNSLNYKDIVSAEVIDIDEVRNATLGNERKLFGGEIIEINPVRIPRVIGKNNSMLKLLKDKTGCSFFVGRNGRIWIKGKNSPILADAIFKIEREAHTSGLTERIEKYLDEMLKG
ncbi:RNA-binding protein [Candidatus Micrarchaeota archaeon]|nr:MAG: RNA-binding protein [Candidatus Micrarchaeota archaeon]